jgi:hypothetical protein
MQEVMEFVAHPHIPRDINAVHIAEMTNNFNQKLALKLSGLVDSMWTAYVFACIAFAGLFGLLGWLNPFVFLLMTWLSQQFLQLVYLPIITVKQGVQEAKTAMQAEEVYKNAMMVKHNSEVIIAQNQQIIEQNQQIIAMMTKQ